MTNNRRMSGASSQGSVFPLAQVYEHAETKVQIFRKECLIAVESIRTYQLGYEMFTPPIKIVTVVSEESCLATSFSTDSHQAI